MTPQQRAAAERLVDNMNLSLETWIEQAENLLRELLAEPVQDEPVAWLKTMYSGTRPILEVDHRKPPATNSIPVYAAPQQPMRCPTDGGECGAGGYCRPEPKQRGPLTDKDIVALLAWDDYMGGCITLLDFARAIERAITGEQK